MFELTENHRYYVCQQPVSMNKGIFALSNYVKSEMGMSPVSGDVFVFFSKGKKQVKILKWDEDGFVLYQKRLQRGTFEVPRYNFTRGSCELPWNTFYFIMRGITISSVQFNPRLRISNKSCGNF